MNSTTDSDLKAELNSLRPNTKTPLIAIAACALFYLIGDINVKPELTAIPLVLVIVLYYGMIDSTNKRIDIILKIINENNV